MKKIILGMVALIAFSGAANAAEFCETGFTEAAINHYNNVDRKAGLNLIEYQCNTCYSAKACLVATMIYKDTKKDNDKAMFYYSKYKTLK